jgi:hypothetical protein
MLREDSGASHPLRMSPSAGCIPHGGGETGGFQMLHTHNDANPSRAELVLVELSGDGVPECSSQ